MDFEPDFLVYLTVENFGRTMARDVSIRFDKSLESTLSRPREIDESPLFRQPIPTLPPGKKIRVLFDSFPDRLNAELPLTYDVELRYRGPTGRKEWTDLYRLDLAMYVGAALQEKGIPELTAEVQKIRQEMQKWLGSKLKGLQVETIDKRQLDRLDDRRRDMRVLRQQGARALGRRIWQRALRRFGLS